MKASVHSRKHAMDLATHRETGSVHNKASRYIYSNHGRQRQQGGKTVVIVFPRMYWLTYQGDSWYIKQTTVADTEAEFVVGIGVDTEPDILAGSLKFWDRQKCRLAS